VQNSQIWAAGRRSALGQALLANGLIVPGAGASGCAALSDGEGLWPGADAASGIGSGLAGVDGLAWCLAVSGATVAGRAGHAGWLGAG
jgi:hypothetical protein